MCGLCVQVPKGSKGVRSPALQPPLPQVTGSCEPPCVGAGN